MIALAGSPNTGKSTVFNRLTGLRQRTGNWPGKTVARAEGAFSYRGAHYKLIDLPGIYALGSVCAEEQVARDFLLSGTAHAVLIIADATSLERCLGLILQVLAVTDRAVVCVNLIDEAQRNGVRIDIRTLGRELGVPVVAISARHGDGIDTLLDAMHDMASARVMSWSRRASREALGDEIAVQSNHAEAARIAALVVHHRENVPARRWDQRLDAALTSRWLGFPIMVAVLAAVFWITIAGANVPSSLLASFLLDTVHPLLKGGAASLGMPWWLDGLLCDGIYLGAAWVLSVMLPPMAIFFPLFTLLEDFGYLPRVAFNLDRLFAKAGAHGKQALSMSMGYGCNAAGVIATRIIDSPRERLIAIITNNFSLCNGRWPTQILIASLFIGALVPPALTALTVAAVVGVAILGFGLTLATSWALSRTVLRGEPSVFSLELPPYRPPSVLATLYTSVIDRTAQVLWRAIVFAVPAGALTWTLANVHVADLSVAEHLITSLEPFGWLLGLNGVILLAYLIAVPANEIVVPAILMLTVLSARVAGVGEGAGVLFDPGDPAAYREIFAAGGWTLLTAINLMLFSLVHNPCSTTIYTIYKETGSRKWTAVATLLPLLMGFLLCFLVAQVWRALTS